MARGTLPSALLASILVLANLPSASAAPLGAARAGGSVAAYDFNGDGFADLAVGVPAEDIGEINRAGAVNVIYGTARGLRSAGNQFWSPASAGRSGLDASRGRYLAARAAAPRSTFSDDFFGEALAIGDFDGDGYGEAAVGDRNALPRFGCPDFGTEL